MATPHESGASGYQISYVGETCVETLNNTLNDICPPGHYCPVGSDSPVQCPPGTNSSSTGLANVTNCPLCISGYYCPLNGTVYATRKCLPGYYCPSGTSMVGHHPSNVCPTGTACPTGSSHPTICSAGTYQDALEQPSCKVRQSNHSDFMNQFHIIFVSLTLYLSRWKLLFVQYNHT